MKMVKLRPGASLLAGTGFNGMADESISGAVSYSSPEAPLEVPNDMINLWRGFGITPKQGDWSLLHSHILHEICSSRQELFDYLIKWMAHAVQHPDKPGGVAVAFLGPQ